MNCIVYLVHYLEGFFQLSIIHASTSYPQISSQTGHRHPNIKFIYIYIYIAGCSPVPGTMHGLKATHSSAVDSDQTLAAYAPDHGNRRCGGSGS